MKRIPRPLSSKNQVTLPKTVRDILGITDKDSTIDFVIEKDMVFIEKGKETHVCPFCLGKDFYGETCEVCNDTGMLDEVTTEELISKFNHICISYQAIFSIDTREEIYRIDVVSDDVGLKRYREHFQMEFIKLVLKHYKVKDLLDKELKEKLVCYLEFETSRESFSIWWDRLIQKYV